MICCKIVYLTQRVVFWHLLILHFDNWLHYIQILQGSWWSWLSVFVNKCFVQSALKWVTEIDWSVRMYVFTLDFGRVTSGRFLAFTLRIFCQCECQLKRLIVFVELTSLCVKSIYWAFCSGLLNLILNLILVWCQTGPVHWSVSTASLEMLFWSPLHMKHRVEQKNEPQTGFSELIWANTFLLLHGWLDFRGKVFFLLCCWK